MNSPIKQAIQLSNHPFRFLLYLEWGLLAVAMLSTLEGPPARIASKLARDGPPPGWQHDPVMAIIPLLIFGVMGLYLPLSQLPRLGHTLGQILLILLASATVFDSGRIFPFVYLILVIRSCLMFGLAGRLIMTGVAFGLFLVGLQFRLRSLAGIGHRLPPPLQRRLSGLIMSLQLNFIVLFGLSLLLVVLLINALLTERQSQQRLQQANQNLRESAQAIEKLAMDQERTRIAREIHDSLGHSLTALNIQLESALKLWEKDSRRSQKFLAEAKRLGTQSLNEVRHSVASLRQDPLAGRPLEEAIAHLLQNLPHHLAHSSALSVTHHIEIARPLPSNLNAILYRIVQEGLTNIVKHAKASHVHLRLVGAESAVMLTIEDDGIGFDTSQALTGFGLQSMRDRAQAAGGTFTLTSSPHTPTGGSRLQVSLPLPAIPMA